jgi:hypothetical protein
MWPTPFLPRSIFLSPAEGSCELPWTIYKGYVLKRLPRDVPDRRVKRTTVATRASTNQKGLFLQDPDIVQSEYKPINSIFLLQGLCLLSL